MFFVLYIVWLSHACVCVHVAGAVVVVVDVVSLMEFLITHICFPHGRARFCSLHVAAMVTVTVATVAAPVRERHRELCTLCELEWQKEMYATPAK